MLSLMTWCVCVRTFVYRVDEKLWGGGSTIQLPNPEHETNFPFYRAFLCGIFGLAQISLIFICLDSVIYSVYSLYLVS